MRHGAGFRVLAALLTLGLVALLVAGAYGAGLNAGSGGGTAGWHSAAYVFWPGHIVGFLIGLFIFFLFLRLIMFAIFGGHYHRRWHHGWDAPDGFGHDRPGYTDWQRGPWHEARRNAFDEWHRAAHEAQTPPPAPPSSEAPRQ